MPNLWIYAAAQLAAAVGAAVVVVVLGRVLKGSASQHDPRSDLWAIAVGILIGCCVLQLHVSIPPRNGLDRFLLLILPLTGGIEFLATAARLTAHRVWLLRAILMLFLGRILLHDSVYLSPATPPWSAVQVGSACVAGGFVVLSVWGLLSLLTARSPAKSSVPLAVAVTMEVTGVAIMLAGYLQGGATALVVAVVLMTVIAMRCWLKIAPNPQATLSIGIVSLSSLLFIGRFFGGLTSEVALTLLVTPLLCWGTELPWVRSRPVWLVSTLRLSLVAIPLVCILWQAKRDFDLHTAPLLIQSLPTMSTDG